MMPKISPALRRSSMEMKLSGTFVRRSEEHTSELQSRSDLVCRLLLEKKKKNSVMFISVRVKRSYTPKLQRCFSGLFMRRIKRTPTTGDYIECSNVQTGANSVASSVHS